MAELLANGWKRLANFAIDLLCYCIWNWFIEMGLVNDAFGMHLDSNASDANMGPFLAYAFFSYWVWVLYYAVLESATGGKTIGKYVTGTRAVNADGSRLSVGRAIARAFIRSIPLECLSAFVHMPPYPWHDRWTKTLVIDNRPKP